MFSYIYIYIYISGGGVEGNPGNLNSNRECTDVAELIQVTSKLDPIRVGSNKIGDYYYWKCPTKKPGPPRSGNFIGHKIEQTVRWTTIELKDVQTTFCQPKPKQCSCSSLLDSLLLKNPSVDRIAYYFDAEPFMAGCKCYFGAAVRAGFKYVKLNGWSISLEKCTGIKKLTKRKYPQMCQKLHNKNCYGLTEITKQKPDKDDQNDY